MVCHRGVEPADDQPCFSMPLSSLCLCASVVNNLLASQVAVDDVLDHLLPAGDVRGRLALLEHVLLQRLEAGRPLFDVRPDARLPGRVALLDQLLQPAVLADPGGDLEPLGERVHRPDVGVEQVHRLKTLPPNLAFEVKAARGDPACPRTTSMVWAARYRSVGNWS